VVVGDDRVSPDGRVGGAALEWAGVKAGRPSARSRKQGSNAESKVSEP